MKLRRETEGLEARERERERERDRSHVGDLISRLMSRATSRYTEWVADDAAIPMENATFSSPHRASPAELVSNDVPRIKDFAEIA